MTAGGATEATEATEARTFWRVPDQSQRQVRNSVASVASVAGPGDLSVAALQSLRKPSVAVTPGKGEGDLGVLLSQLLKRATGRGSVALQSLP